ncbi:hypothetical protein Tco_1103573 [Tanacetum coccineum]
MRDIVRLKTERELVRIKINDGNAFWNEIRVNAGVSKLMLLSINLLLPVLVYAARHSLTAFWTTAKAKTFNGERQIQALVDKNKVIINEKSVASNLMLEDAKGTECLPNDGRKSFLLGMNTPLFQTMIVQAPEDMGEDSAAPTDSYSTPIITQPSSSKSQKKKSKRKQRKDSGPTEPIPDKTTMKNLYLPLHVLDLEEAKTAQAKEIASLKKREDASKQGRKIADLDADAEVTLINETQERNDEEMFFDVQDDLQGEEVVAEKEVAEKEVSAADPVTTAGERLKQLNTKAVTTAATTITTVVAKARGIVVQEPSEFKTTSSPSQLPQAKYKGKAKMVEPEKPLKKKDQIALDEEVARNLEAQLQAELDEEERLAIQKEEEAAIALVESWDNIQAMIEADRLLAERLQIREQEELIDKEKARLFVELLKKRKKHFAALRAKEKRNKPPTKAQNINTMSTYLKNMAGYKHNQLKSKSYDEIQEIFDKEMKRVNTFVDMNTKLVKGSKTKVEGSSKRAGDELEQEKAKKQKGDDDQEEEEMKKHMEIVQDDEVAIDAIPLATKPPVIVEWKIIKEGKIGYFKLIRADGSSKRYSSMIQMLQNIDREDLETLWKLVKAKHGNTRPEEAYERVLWGDLKVMFEPDIESEVWRSLEGHNVTVWKLFSSSGVHFVRFKHLHIFMLVEKKYPLTPATITGMLNKKLQTDQWNEMCYQLLKLMTKQQKNPGSV